MATFHPFPRLPFELRDLIWGFSVEPRIVELDVDYELNYIDSTRICPWRYMVSSTPTPAVLQVCQEARNHGSYKKVFTELASPFGVGPQYIWANLEVDIINIGWTEYTAFEEIATSIRKLQFERDPSCEHWYQWEYNEMRLFSNAKEIYAVCAYGDVWHWLEAFKWRYWPCGIGNVHFIDPTDGHVYKGEEGLGDMEFVAARRMDNWGNHSHSWHRKPWSNFECTSDGKPVATRPGVSFWSK